MVEKYEINKEFFQYLSRITPPSQQLNLKQQKTPPEPNHYNIIPFLFHPQHHTTPHYTTPNHISPHHNHTTPHHTTPPPPLLHHTTITPHRTTPHHTTPHHTTPHHTTPHHHHSMLLQQVWIFKDGLRSDVRQVLVPTWSDRI